MENPDFFNFTLCRTSADLFKTAFDLMVSVTLFVGRFDMRMMQASGAWCGINYHSI